MTVPAPVTILALVITRLWAARFGAQLEKAGQRGGDDSEAIHRQLARL